ncbi:MAG: sugar ABC transporter substrate-binding protein [Promethearchaeota archaeon]
MKKQQEIVVFVILTTLLTSIFGSGLIIPAKAQTTTLEMWYMQEDFLDDTMLDLIDQYENSHDVSINLKYVPYDTMRLDFKTAYVLGEAPDLIQGDSEWIPDFAHRNYISPLSVDELQYEYISQALRAVSYFFVDDGEYNTQLLTYYGIPQFVDVMAFIYNKDEMRTATIPTVDGSWTIDDFKQAITRMNDQSLPNDKQFGFSFLNFLDTEFALFFGAGGILFANDTVDAKNNQILEDYSVNALKFIYDMVNYYELTPSYKSGYYVNVDNSLKMDKIYDDFAVNGNVSSTMLYAQNMKKLLSSGIFTDISKLGIAPTPRNTADNAPYLSVTALMLSNSTTHREEALDLANYLCSPDAMKEYATNEYLLPAIDSVYSDTALAGNTIIQSYKPFVDTAQGIPISRFWNVFVKDIFDGEVTSMIRGAQNASTCAVSLQIRLDYQILNQADHPSIHQDVSNFKYYGEEESAGGIPFGSPQILGIFSLLGIGLILLLNKKNRRE